MNRTDISTNASHGEHICDKEHLYTSLANALDTGDTNEARRILIQCISGESIPESILHDVTELAGSAFLDGILPDSPAFLALLCDKQGKEALCGYYLGLCTAFPDELCEPLADLTRRRSAGALPSCPSGSVSNNSFCKSYDFKGTTHSYSIHSFSDTIGRNSTILKTPYGAIMLDCGARSSTGCVSTIDETAMLGFFKSIGISADDLLAVIISHAHLDHYGSLPTLLRLGIDKSRIFIEDTSRMLIRSLSSDLPSLSDTLTVRDFYSPFGRVRIKAFENGHIPGSHAYLISFDERNILYTGDFSVCDTGSVKGFRVSDLLELPEVARHGIDCIITETTHGKFGAPLKYNEITQLLSHFASLLAKKGYGILIPSCALGKAVETSMLLGKDHKVLIGGRVKELGRIYSDLGIGTLCRNIRFADTHLRASDLLFASHDVIIADAEAISEACREAAYDGTSDIGKKVAVIRTECDGNDTACSALVARLKSSGAPVLELPLVLHADFDEIYSVIKALSPNHLVCIHGDGLPTGFVPKSPDEQLNGTDEAKEASTPDGKEAAEYTHGTHHIRESKSESALSRLYYLLGNKKTVPSPQ